MPIVGFEVNLSDALKGLPRIAKLHKGSKKIERKRADGSIYETVGKDLDYFRIEFEPEYAYLADDWRAMYGDKPTHFEPVLLNADTMPDALDYWKEEWTATTMLRRCDGNKQHIWYDNISGRYEHTPRSCVTQCGCKAIARVNLILPDFITQTGVLGYVVLQTTSEEDIRTLIKRLSAVQVTYGTLRGVPFSFYRRNKDTTAPEMNGKARTGKRIKVTRSLIDVAVDPEFTRQRLIGALAGVQQQLPASRTSVDISTEDARRMLGSGENRRIGAETAYNADTRDANTADEHEAHSMTETTQTGAQGENPAILKTSPVGEMTIKRKDANSKPYAVIAGVTFFSGELLRAAGFDMTSSEWKTPGKYPFPDGVKVVVGYHMDGDYKVPASVEIVD